MYNKSILKCTACIVLVTYISVFNTSVVFAGQAQLTVKSQLFAQALAPNSVETAEEGKALREIYLEKIRRIEAKMNNARGSRNTMVTTGVVSILIGTGLLTGSETVRNAVDEIPVNDENEDDINSALDALDAVKSVGSGIAAVSAVSLVGYLLYTGIISSKQKKIDTLRSEMDIKFEMRGLTPEYLRRNESVAAVLEEISDTKKSVGRSRGLQGLFSRIGIGTLLSGGFLVGLSSVANEVVDEIDVNENDPAEVDGRENALDEADNLQTTGIVLLGVGAGAELFSLFFRMRAGKKEGQIDDLENSLLRVAERIDIQPRIDGVAILYTHEF